MDPHDLAVAKLCAGREKDLEFVQGLVAVKIIEFAVLLQRVAAVSAPAEIIELAKQRLAVYFRVQS